MNWTTFKRIIVRMCGIGAWEHTQNVMIKLSIDHSIGQGRFCPETWMSLMHHWEVAISWLSRSNPKGWITIEEQVKSIEGYRSSIEGYIYDAVLWEESLQEYCLKAKNVMIDAVQVYNEEFSDLWHKYWHLVVIRPWRMKFFKRNQQYLQIRRCNDLLQHTTSIKSLLMLTKTDWRILQAKFFLVCRFWFRKTNNAKCRDITFKKPIGTILIF